MCGIYGLLAPPDRIPTRESLERMGAALFHRGPDEGGIFTDGGIALGSRRLSIVDLATGRQPLQNETGSIHIVCNGEIYNAPALRKELEGRHEFRTHSDVEVLVHLYEDHGLDFLEHIDGMFAIALWDAPAKRLILVRDRAGEKPLYYAWRDRTLFFASELAALRKIDGIGREEDADGLRLYLAFGYLPAPHSPYRDIRKLPPGTLAIAAEGAVGLEMRTYWSLWPHATEGATRPSRMTEAEAARELRERIDASVRRQLMGDVPAGVALSGGLDSGWIATVAAKESSERLHTFTVSFADASYDEGDAAAWLAGRLGTIHHVARADTASLARAADFLGRHLDEPLGDPAVLPTFLLAEEARRHVKVILGGEGADELFGGYPTYLGHRLARDYTRWPRWLRERLLRPLIESWPASEGKVSIEFLLKRFVRHAGRPLLDRHAAWFGAFPPDEVDALVGPRLADANADPIAIYREMLGSEAEWEAIDGARHSGSPGERDLEKVLYLDFRTYLGEGLLTKIDRASMSCSLESRSPYLSREVVEFAAHLPIEMKVHGSTTKRILREAAMLTVPPELLKRRKRGLSVPLAGMFRRELRAVVEAEFDPARLDAEGFLDGAAVGRIVAQHTERRADRARAIFTLLALTRWYRNHLLGG
jgi:asparagine synthase (glutamine-hydrolysing)